MQESFEALFRLTWMLRPSRVTRTIKRRVLRTPPSLSFLERGVQQVILIRKSSYNQGALRTHSEGPITILVINYISNPKTSLRDPEGPKVDFGLKLNIKSGGLTSRHWGPPKKLLIERAISNQRAPRADSRDLSAILANNSIPTPENSGDFIIRLWGCRTYLIFESNLPKASLTDCGVHA